MAKEKSHFPYMVIVALVAIVAVVVLVLNVRTSSESVAETGEALAGEAIRTTRAIAVGDVFLVRTSAGALEIVEYYSADRITKTNPKINFRVWSTGETLELPINPNGTAQISIGGKTLTMKLLSPDQEDSWIHVDLNADGKIDSIHMSALLHFK